MFISEPFWISCTVVHTQWGGHRWATSRERGGKGCCSQGWDSSLSSALSPRRSQLQPCLLSVPLWSFSAHPQLLGSCGSVRDAFPRKPCSQEGCTVPTEVLRSRDWIGRLISMCWSPSILSGKVYTWNFWVFCLRSCDWELLRCACVSVVPANTGSWDPTYPGRREHLLHSFSFPENADFFSQK